MSDDVLTQILTRLAAIEAGQIRLRTDMVEMLDEGSVRHSMGFALLGQLEDDLLKRRDKPP